jgi:Tlde1 domain
MKRLYVCSIMVAGSLLALVRNPALTSTPSDNRVFLETTFDTPQHAEQQLSQPALAYAAPESGFLDDVLDSERKIISGPLLGLHSWTAVYDISAHTVYLPDGTKLEAHSGRGGRLDDPRYVHEHMRGATPPNVYELALREKTFHGVQALRLKPVGGGNTFGRSGLLAHTYMLGPKGESNGCLVFKNYNAFLQAFQNGLVKRLIVVDNLKIRKGYELTLAQASFAPFAVIGPEQSLAPRPARGAKLVCENQVNLAAGQEAAR